MEDQILTKMGVEFLEDVSELYRAEGWNALESQTNLGPMKEGSPVIDMPCYKEGYGDLIQSDKNYVAKFASFNGPMHIYRYDNGQDTLLSSEEFIEPLTWIEARERNDSDLFAEVGAWDADFKWMLMEKVDSVERKGPVHEEVGAPMLEKRGWRPKDIEIGYKWGKPVAIDYGLVRPEEEWLLDESHVLNSDRCIWNRPTVPEKDIDQIIEIDQSEVYDFIKRNAPASITQDGTSKGPKYDAFRAFEMKSFVNKTLSGNKSSQDNAIKLSEAVHEGVKNSKTASALFTCLAEYSGLDAQYVQGVKKPKTSKEAKKQHSWVSIFFGETEHLIDPELDIIGRYEPMINGHEYQEQERVQVRPPLASP